MTIYYTFDTDDLSYPSKGSGYVPNTLVQFTKGITLISSFYVNSVDANGTIVDWDQMTEETTGSFDSTQTTLQATARSVDYNTSTTVTNGDGSTTTILTETASPFITYTRRAVALDTDAIFLGTYRQNLNRNYSPSFTITSKAGVTLRDLTQDVVDMVDDTFGAPLKSYYDFNVIRLNSRFRASGTQTLFGTTRNRIVIMEWNGSKYVPFVDSEKITVPVFGSNLSGLTAYISADGNTIVAQNNGLVSHFDSFSDGGVRDYEDNDPSTYILSNAVSYVHIFKKVSGVWTKFSKIDMSILPSFTYQNKKFVMSGGVGLPSVGVVDDVNANGTILSVYASYAYDYSYNSVGSYNRLTGLYFYDISSGQLDIRYAWFCGAPDIVTYDSRSEKILKSWYMTKDFSSMIFRGFNTTTFNDTNYAKATMPNSWGAVQNGATISGGTLGMPNPTCFIWASDSQMLVKSTSDWRILTTSNMTQTSTSAFNTMKPFISKASSSLVPIQQPTAHATMAFGPWSISYVTSKTPGRYIGEAEIEIVGGTHTLKSNNCICTPTDFVGTATTFYPVMANGGSGYVSADPPTISIVRLKSMFDEEE